MLLQLVRTAPAQRPQHLSPPSKTFSDYMHVQACPPAVRACSHCANCDHIQYKRTSWWARSTNQDIAVCLRQVAHAQHLAHGIYHFGSCEHHRHDAICAQGLSSPVEYTVSFFSFFLFLKNVTPTEFPPDLLLFLIILKLTFHK